MGLFAPPERLSARRHRGRAARSALGWLVLVAGLLHACGSSDGVLLCGQIPDQGCPRGRGGSCDDVTCAAIYDCVDGDWTEVEHCGGGGTVAASSASGAGGCEVTEIDHADESDGCTPDLLEPDCPAVAAEVCMPCETGCSDFFLCTHSGWVDVAACDEAGGFLVFTR